jgi:hypothetical protein
MTFKVYSSVNVLEIVNYHLLYAVSIPKKQTV